ncbi:GTP-binding protein REM 1-like [Limulus polyphemus]|uniref:GTP-binding protein REM 1-like n=1 Tax=Limulus polyphemus TaxID=6850 RepID=A0ABM1TCK6_LIMPO|nr:GTP-binding protein REM 1-like [Limulus polyphemus]
MAKTEARSMPYSRTASAPLSNTQAIINLEVKKKKGSRERTIRTRRKTAPIVMLPASSTLENRESPGRLGDELELMRPSYGTRSNRSKNGTTKDFVHRSQSVRTSHRPQSLDPANRSRQRINSITDDTFPERSSSNCSLPLPEEERDYYQRLRNFSITPKGVINRGDSFRSKSYSSHSVSSCGSQPPTAELSVESSDIPACSTVRYRILVLGCPGVGKSALTTQFTTSEYICAYDTSLDEENEKLVTVVLNGEESELLFVEHTLPIKADSFQPLETMLNNADAIITVYSSCDKTGFRKTRDTLLRMNNVEERDPKPVILVGNKTDLARLRVVSTKDARALATSIGCKFIETSVGINHNVDELLVGILSQIRLKGQQLDGKRESVTLAGPPLATSSYTGCKAKVFIRKLLEKTVLKSKSCNNLHVL